MPGANSSRSPKSSARRSSKRCWARACVPDDSPYTTGGIGLLGTEPSQDAMEDCDTLLMVGHEFPVYGVLSQAGQSARVQIDLDPVRIGLRYPVEVGLVGDSQNTLKALLPLLKCNEDRGFLEKAQAGMKDWRELMLHAGHRHVDADETAGGGARTG